MRRILLFITDLEIGGTPTVARELARRLSSDAHLHVACLKQWGPVADQLRESGIPVTALGVSRIMQTRQATRALEQLIIDQQIDTVFSFLIHANYIASRAARRLTSVRFLQSIQTTQPRPRWHWWLQKRIHHKASRIVVPSESVARVAIERCAIPREQLIVIPNAIDMPTETQSRDTIRRIGFVGRLDPVKRVPDLVRAMTHLPDTMTLHIFGIGADQPTIEQTIRDERLQTRVTLHGLATSPAEAHRQIDLLVLPSQAEGFGLVLIEAMAAGLPVVATDVEGIRDVVRHEQTGLLVKLNDPAMIAQAILRIANDESLRASLTQHARADVQRRFGWASVLQHYRDVLQIDS